MWVKQVAKANKVYLDARKGKVFCMQEVQIVFSAAWVYMCALNVWCKTVTLINLSMTFIVTPLPFIGRTTGIVDGSLSVSLALNKISLVLIAHQTLRSSCLPQDPDVRASSVLPEKTDQVRVWKRLNTINCDTRAGYVDPESGLLLIPVVPSPTCPHNVGPGSATSSCPLRVSGCSSTRHSKCFQMGSCEDISVIFRLFKCHYKTLQFRSWTVHTVSFPIPLYCF